MRTWPKIVRVIERGLILLGLLLLGTFSLACIHRFVMLRAEIRKFEARQLESAKEGHGEVGSVGHAFHKVHQVENIEHALWSAPRLKLHQTTLRESGKTLAILRIRRLHLEAPLLEGTDELTLNRGVGRIAGTAGPGESGNIGIAGHRDGFFRALKDINVGDSIELVTRSGSDVYAVDRIRITDPSDVSVLRPGTKPSVTLVTCYPFYFIGPAPKRYIVEASLNQSTSSERFQFL